MQNLIAGIHAAFASLPYPGDDNLTDSTYGEEPAALVEAFRGKTDWCVLDSKFIDQAPDGWGSALSFFSGAALRFYLPAYLVADLKGKLQASDPAIRLCMNLTIQTQDKKVAKRWGGGTLGEIDRKTFGQFSPEQVSVIVAYLWWRLELDTYNSLIEQALQNYWLECEGTKGRD